MRRKSCVFGLPALLFLAYFLPAAHAGGTTAQPAVDPDGDDPRTELLYHWDDPQFTQDERRQMAGIVAGLAMFRAGTLLLRRKKAS